MEKEDLDWETSEESNEDEDDEIAVGSEELSSDSDDKVEEGNEIVNFFEYFS